MIRFTRFLLPLSLILLSLTSCEKEELPLSLREDCDGGSCTYLIFDNAELNVTNDEIVEIVSGEKLVFTYQYTADEDPDIADDEYVEFIRFEIEADSTTTSFNYEGRDLRKINALMHASCFCPAEVADIRTGTISGTLLEDGSWDVDVEVSFDYGTNRMIRTFEENFLQN